jgi:hypothetical protein
MTRIRRLPAPALLILLQPVRQQSRCAFISVRSIVAHKIEARPVVRAQPSTRSPYQPNGEPEETTAVPTACRQQALPPTRPVGPAAVNRSTPQIDRDAHPVVQWMRQPFNGRAERLHNTMSAEFIRGTAVPGSMQPRRPQTAGFAISSQAFRPVLIPAESGSGSVLRQRAGIHDTVLGGCRA